MLSSLAGVSLLLRLEYFNTFDKLSMDQSLIFFPVENHHSWPLNSVSKGSQLQSKIEKINNLSCLEFPQIWRNVDCDRNLTFKRSNVIYFFILNFRQKS